MKNYEFAHRDYDWAIEKEPNNPRYWHAKGLSYEAISNKQEVLILAIKAYEQSLAIDPAYFGSWFHLGKMYTLNKQYKEALNCFSNVIKNYTKDGDIYI